MSSVVTRSLLRFSNQGGRTNTALWNPRWEQEMSDISKLHLASNSVSSLPKHYSSKHLKCSMCPGLAVHDRLVLSPVLIKQRESWRPLIQGSILPREPHTEFKVYKSNSRNWKLGWKGIAQSFSNPRTVSHIGRSLSAFLNSNLPLDALLGVDWSGKVEGIQGTLKQRKEVERQWEINIIKAMSVLRLSSTHNQKPIKLPVSFTWIPVRSERAQNHYVLNINVSSWGDQVQSQVRVVWFQGACWYFVDGKLAKMPMHMIHERVLFGF